MNRTLHVADALVERLTHGHERHGQRWHLHLPRGDEPAVEVRPLLVLLGLPTFGLALAISVLTTYGPVILIQLAHSPQLNVANASSTRRSCRLPATTLRT